MVELRIQDDVSVLDHALEVTKAAFFNVRTRPLEFRLQQIKALLRGIKKERKALCEALRKDLGREEFASWFYELALVEQECEHVIKHLPKWI